MYKSLQPAINHPRINARCALILAITVLILMILSVLWPSHANAAVPVEHEEKVDTITEPAECPSSAPLNTHDEKRDNPRYAHVYRFIDTYAPAAVWANRELGILASVNLAQGGNESGWGLKTCGGNNLYGIKGYYDGAANVCASGEYEGGEAVVRDSAFKAYPDGRHSFYDHAWTLCGPRYEKVRTAKTYQEACWALQEAGYATSPTYAEDLIDIIEDFRLYEYDLPRDVSRGDSQEIKNPAKDLQTALADRGYDLGPCGIDGIVGPATRRAVKAFQADSGITVDGVIGPVTWALLMEDKPYEYQFG